MKNKKGQATEGLFIFGVTAFLIIILIGTFLYTYNIITTNLLDPSLAGAGAVNFTESVENTMGQINTAGLRHANIFSIFILFGMVFALLFNAYVTRDQFPPIFFVIDILIILFAYILSVYLANAYELVIGEIPFVTIFTSNLNLSTTFLLLLPKIILIVGALVMIISYSAIPKTKEEEVAGI